MSNVPDPGLRHQTGVRTFFRVVGPLLLAVAFVMAAIAFVDFFGSMDSFGPPTRFWMFFAAFPLFAVGGWMTQAGYAGVAARYASGELSPVVKDGAAYLTDGEGLLGVGRTVDGQPASGPFCRSCGTRNDGDARFCDGCGTSLA